MGPRSTTTPSRNSPAAALTPQKFRPVNNCHTQSTGRGIRLRAGSVTALMMDEFRSSTMF